MPCDVILNANSPPTMLPTPPAFPGDKVYPTDKCLSGMTVLDPYPMQFQDPFLCQADREDLNLSLSLAMELIEEEEGMDDPNHVNSILDSINDGDMGISSDADSLVDSVLSSASSPVGDLDIQTSLAGDFGTPLALPAVSTCQTVTSQTYPMKACPTYEQATARSMQCVNPSNVCPSGAQRLPVNPQVVNGHQLVSQFVATHPTVTSLLTSRPLIPPLINCQFTHSYIPVQNTPVQTSTDVTTVSEISNTTLTKSASQTLTEIQEEPTVEVIHIEESNEIEEDEDEDDPTIPLVALEAAGVTTDIKQEIEREQEEDEEDDEDVKEELMKTGLQVKPNIPSTALRFPTLVASLQSTPILPTFTVKTEPQTPLSQPPTPVATNSAPRGSKMAKAAKIAASRKRRRPSSSDEDDSDEDDDDDSCGQSTGSEDEPRLQRRRLNNRVAAQRCRQRKREYFQGLKKEIQGWECQNTTIRYEIHTLEKELRMLSDILANHECKRTAAQQAVGDGGAPSEQKCGQAEEEDVIICGESQMVDTSVAPPKSKSRKHKHRHDKKRRKKSKHRG